MYDRQEALWGVEIKDRPFTIPDAKIGMFIVAEIAQRRKNRNPEVKFSFTDALGDRKLTMTEMIVWIEHLKAVFEGAKREAERMKAAAADAEKSAASGTKKPAARKRRAKKRA